MHRRLRSLSLAILACLIIVLPARAADVGKEVLSAERHWFDAIVKRDASTLDKLITSDYVSTSDGAISTKAASVQYFTAGAVTIQRIDTADTNVAVYQDAAVVTGVSTWKSKYSGQTSTGRIRHTELWIKQDGRWQVAAWHGSTLPAGK